MRRCAKEANDRFFFSLSLLIFQSRNISMMKLFRHFYSFLFYLFIFHYFSFHPIFLLSFELNKKNTRESTFLHKWQFSFEWHTFNNSLTTGVLEYLREINENIVPLNLPQYLTSFFLLALTF